MVLYPYFRNLGRILGEEVAMIKPWMFIAQVANVAAIGVFGGGVVSSASNVIDYITIASAGNATDFGDLTVSRYALAACSNSHGGLS